MHKSDLVPKSIKSSFETKKSTTRNTCSLFASNLNTKRALGTSQACKCRKFELASPEKPNLNVKSLKYYKFLIKVKRAE